MILIEPINTTVNSCYLLILAFAVRVVVGCDHGCDDCCGSTIQVLKNNASAIYASYSIASAAGGGPGASASSSYDDRDGKATTTTGLGQDSQEQQQQQQGFDVCLLEMRLPVLEGREVLRRYRNWEEEQQVLPRDDPNRNDHMLVLGMSTALTG